MSSRQVIGGINAAFLGVNDLAAHLRVYVDLLGWEIESQGVIGEEDAKQLWGSKVGAVPFTELRAGGAGHGRIILLEVPEQGTHGHPMQADKGLIAINMYTRDIHVTHQELSGAGLKFRTPPASWAVPLGDTMVSVTQMFLLAPEDVDIVFVEPASARGTAAWEADPERKYTELTSVVCHVPDFEAETRFWGPDGLGLESWYDVSFSHPGLDEMAQLPSGSVMRLSFLAGETSARLEITRLENENVGIDRRSSQRTAQHLGHSGWLVVVHDLEEALVKVEALGGTVLAPAHDGPLELFNLSRVAFANTPNGLPVTFMEARS